MPYSYGKILRVDLCSRSFGVETLDAALARAYIGGSGVGSHLLALATPPGSDPLGPDNAIVFAIGPLCGTSAPTSGRHHVLALSPLTGIFAESDVGGAWGTALQATGFDALVITGISEEPVSVIVSEGGAVFEGAQDLWGRDTIETYEHYRSRMPTSEAACIGVAGERLVRMACILHDGRHARAAGRCGIGAVMGSKRLKAVVAAPSRRAARVAHDEAALRESALASARELPARAEVLAKFGTVGTIRGAHYLGDIPVKNWSSGVFDEGIEALTGQRLAESGRLKKRYFCSRCPIGCGRTIELSDGKEGAGPEYETTCMFGSNCFVRDMESVIAANEAANRLGVDTISAGGVIAFLMEAYERGETRGVDLGGIVPTWGDGGAVVSLVRMIGERRGIGELLGEGVERVSRVMGRPEYAIHSKGLELPAHDPRAFNALGLSYATGNRGGCHLQGMTYNFEKSLCLPERGFDAPQDRFGKDRKAELVIQTQNLMSLFDSLKLCKFALFGGVTASRAMEWLRLTTGWDMDLDEFFLAGERIYNLKRYYITAMGVTRADDSLPPRIRQEAKGGGAGTNLPPDLEKSLDEYYRLRGWDGNGVPTEDTLSRLGIDTRSPRCLAFGREP